MNSNNDARVTFADMGRHNSIGFMRIVAASLVIVGHSIPWGGFGADPLLTASHNQIAIGRLPVDVFFVLSGFLVTTSFCRVGNWIVYGWHRILRIFPAVLVCVAFTGLILSPIFGNGIDFRYILWNAPVITGYYDFIPDMFAGTPSSSVNGALWTLPWELRAYVVLGLIGVLGLLKRRWAVTAVFLACWLAFALEIYKYPGPETSPAVTSGVRLFTFFLAGVLFYLYRDSIPVKWQLFAASLGGMVAATIVGVHCSPYPAGVFYTVSPILLAYASLYSGMRLNVTGINNENDRSYGVYIYGTLVLNILVTFGLNRIFGPNPTTLSWVAFILAAFALTYAIATISWYLIEKPALGLKDKRPWRRTCERALPNA